MDSFTSCGIHDCGYIAFDGKWESAFVRRNLYDGRLLLQFFGHSHDDFVVAPELFEPSAEALFWEGHCPDREEHEEEVKGLRLEMADARAEGNHRTVSI